MREFRSHGSVRGALRERRPYREHLRSAVGGISASPVPGRDALKLGIQLKAGSGR